MTATADRVFLFTGPYSAVRAHRLPALSNPPVTT